MPSAASGSQPGRKQPVSGFAPEGTLKARAATDRRGSSPGAASFGLRSGAPMMVPLPLRASSLLIALVVALGLTVSAARASEPVVITSSTWTATGTMKARVNSLQQSVTAVATLEFGPSLDLLAGQFRLTVDDGTSPFSVVGTYEETKPGK